MRKIKKINIDHLIQSRRGSGLSDLLVVFAAVGGDCLGETGGLCFLPASLLHLRPVGLLDL